MVAGMSSFFGIAGSYASLPCGGDTEVQDQSGIPYNLSGFRRRMGYG